MRRKLRGLKLNAIAAVDRPCQEGARACIIKRAEDNDEESTMKTIEQLQAEVDKLTGQLTSANALAATEKVRADTAETTLKTEQDAHVVTKGELAKATDEVIEHDGRKFSKSEVGELSFLVAKSAIEERDQARFEKRASDEFSHVVGTVAEKALVLKAREKMDEAAQKALDAILTSTEKMIAAGFDKIGEHGGVTPTVKQAVDNFEAKVREIETAEKLSGTDAMREARKRFPDLWEESRGGATAN